MREIILDTETTGLDRKVDRVVEIGCVEIDDLMPTGNTFHQYCNPLHPVHKDAFRVHGLSNEFLKTKPTFKRIANKFLRYIQGARLVAHNASFDIGMLNAELERLDLPPLENEVVDTLALSREKRPRGKHTLDALCSAYDIDNSRRTKHGALLDAEILSEVYIELCGGRQFGMQLVVNNDEQELFQPVIRQRPTPLASRVTDEDRAAHAAFVSTLGDAAIWRDYQEPKPETQAACPTTAGSGEAMPDRLFELETEMQFLRRTRHLGMSDEARKARMTSIGGSDAKIIMSGDQRAIERLWHEKRGEEVPEDMSEILLVQLGNVTEALNADWFEFQTELCVTNEQEKVFYPDWEKAHATLDGLVRKDLESTPIGMVEFKFMFPFGFDKDKAVEKYFPQCQHNMMVTGLPVSYLSIITGAAQHIVVEIEADIFYQVELLKAEKDFWECVETGKTPGTPEIVVPLIERVKVVDMSTDNEWGDLAATIVGTLTASKRHEDAKKGIKKIFPKDAKSASGKGVTINLSKDGKQLFVIDKEEVAKADKDSGMNPPAPKKATKPKKAAANSNEETKADAA